MIKLHKLHIVCPMFHCRNNKTISTNHIPDNAQRCAAYSTRAAGYIIFNRCTEHIDPKWYKCNP